MPSRGPELTQSPLIILNLLLKYLSRDERVTFLAWDFAIVSYSPHSDLEASSKHNQNALHNQCS